MPMYGVFDLTGKTIGIIAVVAVVTFVLSLVLYSFDKRVAGVTIGIISFTLTLIGLVTWWTIVNWGGNEGLNGVGICFLSVAVLSIWLGLPAELLNGQTKDRNDQQSEHNP